MQVLKSKLRWICSLQPLQEDSLSCSDLLMMWITKLYILWLCKMCIRFNTILIAVIWNGVRIALWSWRHTDLFGRNIHVPDVVMTHNACTHCNRLPNQQYCRRSCCSNRRVPHSFARVLKEMFYPHVPQATYTIWTKYFIYSYLCIVKGNVKNRDNSKDMPVSDSYVQIAKSLWIIIIIIIIH
jgi:hypothetical protein